MLVAVSARILMYPRTRFYEPWGIYFVSILGAILAAMLLPAETVFLAPFVFLGSLAIYFLGSLTLIWLIGIIMMFLLPCDEDNNLT